MCCFPTRGTASRGPENRLAFNAVAEAFLAAQLGGRFEPIDSAFAGSTITCPEGADQVPGLAAALKSHAADKTAGERSSESKAGAGQ